MMKPLACMGLAFLGGAVKPASGVTDNHGQAHPRIEGSSLPGCNLGIYRVKITKSEGGKEIVPPQYNSKTELGLEVGTVVRGQTSFHLRSQ